MTPSNPAAPAPRSNLLYRYVFWTYERGSLHYDVMVTLILLFLFIGPHVIDFHDRPLPEVPGRPSEILVRDAGISGTQHNFEYELRADDLGNTHDDATLRSRISARINTLAPGTQVTAVRPLKDPRGQVVAYVASAFR